jgi:hypothetical protein
MKRRCFGSHLARRLLILVLLCVGISGRAAAQVEGEDETGVPKGSTIENFNEGVISAAGVGGFHDESHSTSKYFCAAPGLLRYEKSKVTDIYEQIKKVAKDGTVTYINGKLLRSERTVTMICNGATLRQYVQCMSCPRTPPASVLGIVAAHLRNKLMELEQPKKTLWPKPSRENQVPLPGMPFFYGIDPQQFVDFQTDWLLVCGFHDCVSVSIRARPERVYFTPGDGTRRKTGCATAEIKVQNSKDAKDKSKVKCRYVYQKAGAFTANLEILYKLEWEFRDWTWDVPPPVRTGVMYGTTGRPFPLIVYERQPVVIG